MATGIYIGVNKSAENLLTNGRLSENTNGWSVSTGYYNTSIEENDYLRLTTTKTEASGATMRCGQNISISGSTADTYNCIYVCAKVRGNTANTSYPRVYLRRYANGSTSVSTSNLSSIDGKSGTGLNACGNEG